MGSIQEVLEKFIINKDNPLWQIVYLRSTLNNKRGCKIFSNLRRNSSSRQLLASNVSVQQQRLNEKTSEKKM